MTKQYLHATRTHRGLQVDIYRLAEGATLYVPMIGSWEIQSARQRAAEAARRTNRIIIGLPG